MLTIEYNNTKVFVPENWDDITLGFYESIYTEKPGTTRERVNLVARICKIDADLLLGWPVGIFNKIVDTIDFLFKDNPAPPDPVVEIEGVRYVVPIEEELSLGAWVDADNVQRNGVNVLSNILSIVCRPAGEDYNYRNSETRAAMFAALPVSKVLGVLAFFLHYKTVLERRTRAYTKLADLAGRLPRSIHILQNLGGGIKLSRIWQILRYCALIVLLRYRFRKLLRSCNTVKTKPARKKRSTN